MHIDFTNVKSGFEPIPEGTYEAIVFEVEQKISQAGKPYLNWQLKLLGGDNDGRRAFYMTSLSPAALWKLKEVLHNLGFSKESLAGEFDLDIASLIGKECTIVIQHEEYNGDTRDRVVNVLPSGSAATGDAGLYR